MAGRSAASYGTVANASSFANVRTRVRRELRKAELKRLKVGKPPGLSLPSELAINSPEREDMAAFAEQSARTPQVRFASESSSSSAGSAAACASLALLILYRHAFGEVASLKRRLHRHKRLCQDLVADVEPLRISSSARCQQSRGMVDNLRQEWRRFRVWCKAQTPGPLELAAAVRSDHVLRRPLRRYCRSR